MNNIVTVLILVVITLMLVQLSTLETTVIVHQPDIEIVAPHGLLSRPAQERYESMLMIDTISDKEWAAIVEVESEGEIDAVGDAGRALGVAQIHKVAVEDVNRILGYNRFVYADRLNPDKSREMFVIYTNYYGPQGNATSFQDRARIWNGGPNGHNLQATIPYWNRVEKHL